MYDLSKFSALAASIEADVHVASMGDEVAMIEAGRALAADKDDKPALSRDAVMDKANRVAFGDVCVFWHVFKADKLYKTVHGFDTIEAYIADRFPGDDVKRRRNAIDYRANIGRDMLGLAPRTVAKSTKSETEKIVKTLNDKRPLVVAEVETLDKDSLSALGAALAPYLVAYTARGIALGLLNADGSPIAATGTNG